MNKTERNYLFELYDNTDFVPNIKNNMDMGSATSQRYDLMEQSKLTKAVSYSILMFGTEKDDREYWKDEVEAAIEALKGFKKHREDEQWATRTSYAYTATLSGW